MYALQLVTEFYGNRCAKRSGLPLINHIHEGLEILNGLAASDTAKAAYCLHPLLQGDADYIQYRGQLTADENIGIAEFALAIDYRRHANAYLCKPETDNWTQPEIAAAVGALGWEVRHMLIADKQQNQKDFMAHHYGTHERSGPLIRYFHNWLDYLGVSELKA